MFSVLTGWVPLPSSLYYPVGREDGGEVIAGVWSQSQWLLVGVVGVLPIQTFPQCPSTTLAQPPGSKPCQGSLGIQGQLTSKAQSMDSWRESTDNTGVGLSLPSPAPCPGGEENWSSARSLRLSLVGKSSNDSPQPEENRVTFVGCSLA